MTISPLRSLRPLVLGSLVAAALLALPLFSATAQQTQPQPQQPPQTEAIQDWNLQCQATQQGANACQLFQEAQLEGTDRPILRALVGYRTPNSDQLTLVLILPLGVSLSKGAFLQVDQSQPVAVPFERCEPGGCLIFIAMNDSLVQTLKGGVTARLIFHDTQQRRGSAVLSLRGFTAGIDRLAANKAG